MEIRPATFDDRPALAELMVAAMQGAGPQFYSETEWQSAAKYLTIPDETLIADGS